MNVISDSFVILPSEAVLLGRTLGEYLEADVDDGGPVSFLHFLWTRLCPFYPVMDRPRPASINDAELPSDIQWDDSARPALRFGFSASLPDAFFLECTEPPMLGRITRGHPARSLPQLVAEHVAPYVARNAGDDARFNLTSDMPWGRVQQKSMPYYFRFEPRRFRTGTDDAREITTSLEQLVAVAENQCGEFFAVGRKIGRVLAECHRFEASFVEILDEAAQRNVESDLDEDTLASNLQQIIESHPEDVLSPDEKDNLPAYCHYLRKRELEEHRRHRHQDDRDGFRPVDGIEWRSSLKETLAELLQDPMLDDRFSSHAAGLLEAEVESLEAWCDPLDWPTEFRKLEKIRAGVWLALGEILYAARRLDDAQKGEEHRPRMSRRGKLPRLTNQSTVDEIRAQLELCERLYHDDGEFVTPKQMLFSLVGGVEVLVQRIWPEHFRGEGRQAKVNNVLRDRLARGSEHEKRMASVALTLYLGYRGDTVHAFDDSHFSWMEALFLFYGLRQLLEWSEGSGKPPNRAT